MNIDHRQIEQWLNQMMRWLGGNYRFTLIIRDVTTDEIQPVSNDDQLMIISSEDIQNMIEASNQRKH